MASFIERRRFLAIIGGLAVAWPLVARSQQLDGLRRIGVLMALAEDDPEAKARLAGFRQGLEERGWSEDHNVRIDVRFAPATAQAQMLARELVALQPDVILAHTTPVTAALQQESRVAPIVFAAIVDPIKSGFVTSIPRPGGNITGVMQYEASVTGKWLSMLKEIAPSLVRVAFVANPKTATWYDYFWRAAQALAPVLGIEPVSVFFENATDIERASSLSRECRTVAWCFSPTSRPHSIVISSSRSLPDTGCRQFISRGTGSRPVGSCPTESITSICFGRPHPMSTASSAATSPPIFRCRQQQSLKPPSTSKLSRRLV
jgi:ABC-type uncharacterized transport system substrate-binding protein